jgi:hypothetical protein
MLVDSRLAVEGAEMANVFLSFIHEEERVAMAARNLLRDKLGTGHNVFLSADSRTLVSTAKLTIGHLLSRDKCFHG